MSKVTDTGDLTLAVDFIKRCKREGAREMGKAILEATPEDHPMRPAIIEVILSTLEGMTKDLA